MNIKDITTESKNFEIIADVEAAEEIKTVKTKFGFKNICNFTLADNTGAIKFTAWEENMKIPMEALKAHKKIKISGATYVTIYKDVKQLNLSKGSKIEMI